MARRISTAQLDDKWRARIKASMLRNRLRDHALGMCEMSATQVRAAEILLKKVVPDLSSVEHSGEVAHRDVSEMDEATLVKRLDQLTKGLRLQ